MSSKYRTLRIRNDVYEHLEILVSIRGQTVPELLNDAFDERGFKNGFFSSTQAPGKHTPRERYIPAARGHTCFSEHISLPPASGYEYTVVESGNQSNLTPHPSSPGRKQQDYFRAGVSSVARCTSPEMILLQGARPGKNTF